MQSSDCARNLQIGTILRLRKFLDCVEHIYMYVYVCIYIYTIKSKTMLVFGFVFPFCGFHIFNSEPFPLFFYFFQECLMDMNFDVCSY